MNPDEYYNRKEVSNSDLTVLKELLHPRRQFGDKEAAFRFGTLVDAVITEPARVDYYHYTVDGEQYTAEEFASAKAMYISLKAEARNDRLLSMVLEQADTQHVSIMHGQEFEYGGFHFQLDTRCKWDWYMPAYQFGGDLKTTSASSQQEFDEAVNFFDWDRSRAWYMDIVGADRDFIYAISKKNRKVFKKFIIRGDETYKCGKAKYEELAFQWWCLNLK